MEGGMSGLELAGWAVLIIGGSMVVAVAGLLVIHRVPKLAPHTRENDLAGFLYAVVGVVYGVLLAFIVFAVWERFSSVDQAVTEEAADLVVVFRDTQTFPEPQRTQAQDDLRAYANEVMDVEWTSHGELKAHNSPDPLNPVWDIYRQIGAAKIMDPQEQVAMEDRLHELEHQRHIRHLASESTLPPLFWPVLICGGIATVGFSYLFNVDDLWAHAIMTGVMAGMIASALFLIFSLNDPFTGLVHVSKHPLLHALQQFHSLNLPSNP
jgi:hypothetical protein